MPASCFTQWNSVSKKRKDTDLPISKNSPFPEATSHCKGKQWFVCLTKMILVRRVCTLECWCETKQLLWVTIYCHFTISFHEQKQFHVFPSKELGLHLSGCQHNRHLNFTAQNWAPAPPNPLQLSPRATPVLLFDSSFSHISHLVYWQILSTSRRIFPSLPISTLTPSPTTLFSHLDTAISLLTGLPALTLDPWHSLLHTEESLWKHSICARNTF